jgi:hypothetical protein
VVVAKLSERLHAAQDLLSQLERETLVDDVP